LVDVINHRVVVGPSDPSVADVDDVATAYQTDVARGLTAAAAALRLARDGANALRSAPAPSRWRRALAQLQDPLVYLLLVAAAVALTAWMIEGREGWPIDAIVIAVVVVLDAVLGWVQEAKAQNAVAALARMTQATSSVVRDGLLLRIPRRRSCWVTYSCWPKATRWEPMRA
jgi:Ca2+-transporting ATPase